MNANYSLDGKTALVTGSSGLLGIEHSLALLECGADLVITDVDLENLKKLQQNLSRQYPSRNIQIFFMDVTSEESIVKVQSNLANIDISINILINNAAINPKFGNDANIQSSGRLENFSLDEWNRQISVGLTGAFLCSKIYGTEMAKSNNNGFV